MRRRRPIERPSLSLWMGSPLHRRQVGVIGELDALEKVIFNYLNAMKFSPDGGAIELGIVVNPTLVRFCEGHRAWD